jgi:hypothetical protein
MTEQTETSPIVVDAIDKDELKEIILELKKILREALEVLKK